MDQLFREMVNVWPPIAALAGIVIVIQFTFLSMHLKRESEDKRELIKMLIDVINKNASSLQFMKSAIKDTNTTLKEWKDVLIISIGEKVRCKVECEPDEREEEHDTTEEDDNE